MSATIVSLFPQKLDEHKPGLIPDHFTVSAGSPDKPSVTNVEAARFRVYMDADRGTFPVPVAAEEIARSIVEDFCSTQLGYSDDAGPGVFFIPEKVGELDLKMPKYAKLVNAANKRQNQWYRVLVAMADDDWSRHRRQLTISDLQRTAARALGLEREWLTLIPNDPDSVATTSNCPACFALVPVGAAICNTCRAILNKEQAQKFEFAK